MASTASFVLPPPSTEGIRKALLTHSNTLKSVIEAFKKCDPMAVSSLQELIEKFEILKQDLEVKTNEISSKLQLQTDTASIAMANPASAAIGVKMFRLGGPIVQLIAEVKAAADLLSLIGEIVGQYITIFGLIAQKIAETVLLLTSLGLNYVKNALANMLSELYIFLAEMKKKAVDYAKNTVRLSLVGGWEKDKATLQGELATLRMAIVSDPNALDTSKEQSAIKSKISILTSAIAWANSSLKTDSAAI